MTARATTARGGQFLERMTVIATPNGALEGLYHRGRGAVPVVLAPGHPRLFGTMESAVLAELAWALSQRGHPTLRFNYRGVGASSGAVDVPPISAEQPPDEGALDGAYQDLCAAIEHQLASTGAHACAIVGYSFGAALASRAAARHERVDHVVLVAPPVRMLPFDFEAIAASGTQLYVACGALDTLAPPDEVERCVARRVGVHRVAHATHDFLRGLSDLGRYVAGTFPGIADLS